VLENFGIGNTTAHFHLEGNSEHVKRKLNKCVTAGKTTGSNILKNDNGIPSRPDATDFTAIKASKTSLESTVIKIVQIFDFTTFMLNLIIIFFAVFTEVRISLIQLQHNNLRF
jgi:hypothetical protein